MLLNFLAEALPAQVLQALFNNREKALSHLLVSGQIRGNEVTDITKLRISLCVV